jgi:hypothetical protein
VSPIIAALDTDGDGVISAEEIANAAASLRKLDKNGDGQLTPDEYRPKPPKPDNQQGGPAGKRGEGPQGQGSNNGGTTSAVPVK